jgi:hypothetical protein
MSAANVEHGIQLAYLIEQFGESNLDAFYRIIMKYSELLKYDLES